MNPTQADLLLGPRAIDKLHAWQGMKDTFNSEEIAQDLNAARDPGQVRVRDKAGKAALPESEKLSPADVANKITVAWFGFGSAPTSVSP